MLTCSLSKLHDGSDHVVVGLSECADGGISGAGGVLHNHVDVLNGKAFLGKGGGIILSSSGFGLLGGSGLGLDTSSGLLLEFLGFSLVEAGVGVFELELTEDGEFALLFRSGDSADLCAKIEMLLDSSDLMARFGARALSAVHSRFSADVARAAYVQEVGL